MISAIERPNSGFSEHEFYPTPAEKASAVLESILINHPFLDGNKRTGYTVMRLTLMNFGYDIEATQVEKYDFIIRIASGNLEYDEILNWIKEHLVEINNRY